MKSFYFFLNILSHKGALGWCLRTFILHHNSLVGFLFFLLFSNDMTGICGFERTNIKNRDVLEIKSPNRPYFYPPNFQCTWKLSAIKRGGSFAFQFLIFDTQPETDIFTIEKRNPIGSATVIFTLSSWMPSNVVAIIEEEELWMEFQSDWAKSGHGFEIRIERLEGTGRTKSFREKNHKINYHSLLWNLSKLNCYYIDHIVDFELKRCAHLKARGSWKVCYLTNY